MTTGLWNVRVPAWEPGPFRHAIVDDFCSDLDTLFAIVEEEPVHPYESDLFAFEATAPEPETDAFAALRDGFGAALAKVLGHARCDMRAYAYRPGHYLLPHTDHQDGLGRKIAYAYYLPSPEPPSGGELELFAGFTSAKRIEPRANRLVVFEVGDASLHQVREVLAGLRISLAGWFY